MPLGSYRVLSEKYIRPLSDSPAPEIALKDRKSMQIDEPNTTGSYGHAAPIMLIAKDGLISRTSNNRFRFSADDVDKNGTGFTNDDYGQGKWKFAGEGNYSARHNIIQKMPEVAYFTGITPLGLYMHEKDTHPNLFATPRIVEAVDPNRIGFYDYRKPSQDNRNLMFDSINRLNYESSEWISFLAGKGISIDTSKNPGVLGLGVEQSPFAAGYYPKQGYLMTEMNFHNTAKRIISRYGLEDKPEAIEAMKRSILLHEIAHVLGVGGKKRDEAFQGRLQYEFYSRMAEKFKGTKMARVYRALAEEGADYAAWYSRTRWGELFDIKEKESPIEFLIAKLEADGIALELRGEKLESYVSARFKETYGALRNGEPSHKKSAGRGSKSSQKAKNLEVIVEDDSNSKEEISEKGSNQKRYSKVVSLSEYKSMNDAKKYAKEDSKESKEQEESESQQSETAEAA
ncbi:hypothetical protein HYT53_03695 [Candidatus Woesearchaeota archaeon]|nr:hypothetical protein [Candidatus Woesearchaeota archaeon]